MRTDSLMFAGIRVAQLVSLSLALAGVILMIVFSRKTRERHPSA
jgi:prolipoprotein diacylglyceryltransferase